MSKDVRTDKSYVLRENPHHVRHCTGQYYTGKAPSSSIQKAKRFTLAGAENAQKYAKTGWYYNVVRVTNKMRFVMLLSGE